MIDIDEGRRALLSSENRKLALYHRETYFRDGLADLDRAVARHGGDPSTFHESAALMIVKPDGLHHGVTPTILRVLDNWGFTVAWAGRVDLERHVWRELWRFQLNVATTRRLDFNDHLFSEPGVLLLLRRPESRDLPASVELASRKGSATIERQSPDCLRAELGQPHRVLSLIHVADEPADVIRELGLLLARRRRRLALDAVLDGDVVRKADVDDLAKELASDGQGGLPAPAEAEVRLRAALAAADDAPARELLVLIDAAPAAGGLDWVLAEPLLESTAANLGRWDLLTASAAWLRPDDDGYTKDLGGVDPSAWLRRAPGSVSAPVS